MDLAPVWPLETERLRLRPLTDRDADALLAYRSQPDACRYVPFEPQTAEVIAAKLSAGWTRTELAPEDGSVIVGAALRDSDRLIGDLTLSTHSAEHRGAEIGWIVDPAFGGRGYATDAVRALLGVAFDVCGLHRVTARIDARNERSLALARRLWMRQEAHLRENEWFKGEWSDEIDFALLDHEWAARLDAAGRP